MNQTFRPGSGNPLSVSALLLLAACASNGSTFDNGAGSGGGSTSSGAAGSSVSGGTSGADNTSGGTGGDTSGGVGGGTGGGSVGPNTGGNVGTGGVGNVGGAGGGGGATGTGGAAQPCPAGNGVNGICHEFYANDNSRNQINYVNEFVTTNPVTGKPMDATSIVWQAPVGDTTANSPRTIEIVDNKLAKSGKAVLVSLNKGFGEFDTTDGTKVGGALNQPLVNGFGITGACRLPDGNTALAATSNTGMTDYIRIVSPSGATVRQFLLPPGLELRAINHNPADDTYWFSKTETVYQVSNQGEQLYKAYMGVGTKGYAVWWRAGGGAYATSGDPSTVVELDNSMPSPKIVSTVGGKGNNFPFLDFFSGFRRLDNGNYVIANWLGHVNNTLVDPWLTAPEVVEFASPPANKIVWQWPRVTKGPAFPNANQSVARQITNVYVIR